MGLIAKLKGLFKTCERCPLCRDRLVAGKWGSRKLMQCKTDPVHYFKRDDGSVRICLENPFMMIGINPDGEYSIVTSANRKSGMAIL